MPPNGERSRAKIYLRASLTAPMVGLQTHFTVLLKVLSLQIKILQILPGVCKHITLIVYTNQSYLLPLCLSVCVLKDLGRHCS